MLLTKTVKIKWCSNSKQWYINKGYKFTKMKDEFNIKVEDLQEGSHVLVDVKCDNPNCKEPYLKPMYYKNYKRSVDNNNKYYCGNCYKEIKHHSKIYHHVKEKRLSFAQWGINKYGNDFLEKYWSDKNILDPWKTLKGTTKEIWIKCQNKDNKHKDYKTTGNRFSRNTSKGKGCPLCAIINKKI